MSASWESPWNNYREQGFAAEADDPRQVLDLIDERILPGLGGPSTGSNRNDLVMYPSTMEEVNRRLGLLPRLTEWGNFVFGADSGFDKLVSNPRWEMAARNWAQTAEDWYFQSNQTLPITTIAELDEFDLMGIDAEDVELIEQATNMYNYQIYQQAQIGHRSKALAEKALNDQIYSHLLRGSDFYSTAKKLEFIEGAIGRLPLPGEFPAWLGLENAPIVIPRGEVQEYMRQGGMRKELEALQEVYRHLIIDEMRLSQYVYTPREEEREEVPYGYNETYPVAEVASDMGSALMPALSFSGFGFGFGFKPGMSEDEYVGRTSWHPKSDDKRDVFTKGMAWFGGGLGHFLKDAGYLAVQGPLQLALGWWDSQQDMPVYETQFDPITGEPHMVHTGEFHTGYNNPFGPKARESAVQNEADAAAETYADQDSHARYGIEAEVGAQTANMTWEQLVQHQPVMATQFLSLAGNDVSLAKSMFIAGATDSEETHQLLQKSIDESIEVIITGLRDEEWSVSRQALDILAKYGKYVPGTLSTGFALLITDGDFRNDLVQGRLGEAYEEIRTHDHRPSSVLGLENTGWGLFMDLGMGIGFDPTVWLFAPGRAAASVKAFSDPAGIHNWVRGPVGQLQLQDTLHLTLRTGHRGALSRAQALTGMPWPMRLRFRSLSDQWANASDVLVPGSKMTQKEARMLEIQDVFEEAMLSGWLPTNVNRLGQNLYWGRLISEMFGNTRLGGWLHGIRTPQNISTALPMYGADWMDNIINTVARMATADDLPRFQKFVDDIERLATSVEKSELDELLALERALQVAEAELKFYRGMSQGHIRPTDEWYLLSSQGTPQTFDDMISGFDQMAADALEAGDKFTSGQYRSLSMNAQKARSLMLNQISPDEYGRLGRILEMDEAAYGAKYGMSEIDKSGRFIPQSVAEGTAKGRPGFSSFERSITKSRGRERDLTEVEEVVDVGVERIVTYTNKDGEVILAFIGKVEEGRLVSGTFKTNARAYADLGTQASMEKALPKLFDWIVDSFPETRYRAARPGPNLTKGGFVELVEAQKITMTPTQAAAMHAWGKRTFLDAMESASIKTMAAEAMASMNTIKARSEQFMQRLTPRSEIETLILKYMEDSIKLDPIMKRIPGLIDDTGKIDWSVIRSTRSTITDAGQNVAEGGRYSPAAGGDAAIGELAPVMLHPMRNILTANLPVSTLDVVMARSLMRRALKGMTLEGKKLGPSATFNYYWNEAVKWVDKRRVADTVSALHRLWVYDKVMRPSTAMVVHVDEVMRIVHNGGVDAVLEWAKDGMARWTGRFDNLAKAIGRAGPPRPGSLRDDVLSWTGDRLQKLGESMPKRLQGSERTMFEKTGKGPKLLESTETGYMPAAIRYAESYFGDDGFMHFMASLEPGGVAVPPPSTPPPAAIPPYRPSAGYSGTRVVDVADLPSYRRTVKPKSSRKEAGEAQAAEEAAGVAEQGVLGPADPAPIWPRTPGEHFDVPSEGALPKFPAGSISSFRKEHRFLSNFEEAPVTIDGIAYKNAEAAFQAQKFKDPAMRARFSDMDASQAKHAGRSIPEHEFRAEWNQVSVEAMEKVVRAKFNQNPELAEKLLATGDTPLIEGNSWGDNFWGVSTGPGKKHNHLGNILMKVRHELRASTPGAKIPASPPALLTPGALSGSRVVNYHAEGLKRRAFPEGTKSIMRDSPYGNPHRVAGKGEVVGLSSGEAAAKYRPHFLDDAHRELREKAYTELTGKKLACVDAPNACHGDHILEYLDYRAYGLDDAAAVAQMRQGVRISPERIYSTKKSLPGRTDGKSPYLAKDQAKWDRADKFIGQGSDQSSTGMYAKHLGDRANPGHYTREDTVFISAEGARTGRMEPFFDEIDKAVAADVKFITDIPADRARAYNKGERQVADYLETMGYSETSPGLWERTGSVVPVKADPNPPVMPASPVEESVSIMRPGPFGNKFIEGTEMTFAESMARFNDWFVSTAPDALAYRERAAATLVGKRLLSSDRGQRGHGHTIIDYLDWRAAGLDDSMAVAMMTKKSIGPDPIATSAMRLSMDEKIRHVPEAFQDFWASPNSSYLRWTMVDDSALGISRPMTMEDAYGMYQTLFDHITALAGSKKAETAAAWHRVAMARLSDDPGARLSEEVLKRLRSVPGYEPSGRSPIGGLNKAMDAMFMHPTSYRQSFIGRTVIAQQTKRLEKLFGDQGKAIVEDPVTNSMVRQMTGGHISAAHGSLLDDVLFKKGIVTRQRIRNIAEQEAQREIDRMMYSWHLTSPAGKYSRAVWPFGKPWADMWGFWMKEVFSRPVLRGSLQPENYGKVFAQIDNILQHYPVPFLPNRTQAMVSRLAHTDFNLEDQGFNQRIGFLWDAMEKTRILSPFANAGRTMLGDYIGVNGMDLGPIMFLPSADIQDFWVSVIPGFGWAPTSMLDWMVPRADEEGHEGFTKWLQGTVHEGLPQLGYGRPNPLSRFAGGGWISYLTRAISNVNYSITKTYPRDFSMITGNTNTHLYAIRAVRLEMSQDEWWSKIFALGEAANTEAAKYINGGAILDGFVETYIHPAIQSAATKDIMRSTARQVVPANFKTDSTNEDIEEIWISLSERFPNLVDYRDLEKFRDNPDSGKIRSAYSSSVRTNFYRLPLENRDLMALEYPGLNANLVGAWQWNPEKIIALDGLEGLLPFRHFTGNKAVEKFEQYKSDQLIIPIDPRKMMYLTLGSYFHTKDRVAKRLYTQAANWIVENDRRGVRWDRKTKEYIPVFSNSWRSNHDITQFSKQFLDYRFRGSIEQFGPEAAQAAELLGIDFGDDMFTGRELIEAIQGAINENNAHPFAMSAGVVYTTHMGASGSQRPNFLAKLLSMDSDSTSAVQQFVRVVRLYDDETETRTGLSSLQGAYDVGLEGMISDVRSQFVAMAETYPALGKAWEDAWYALMARDFGDYPATTEYPKPPGYSAEGNHVHPSQLPHAYRPWVWNVVDGDSLQVSTDNPEQQLRIGVPLVDAPYAPSFGISKLGPLDFRHKPKVHEVRLLGVRAAEYSDDTDLAKVDHMTLYQALQNAPIGSIWLVRDPDTFGVKDKFERELAWLYIDGTWFVSEHYIKEDGT